MKIKRILFATMLLALLLSLVPATASANVAWHLMDYQQQPCVSVQNTSAAQPTTYYGIWIQGTWSHAINVGATQLPSGATQWSSYTPIPPGSSDGVGSLAYVAVALNRNTPVGSYRLNLWASDGKSTQSVPVTLRVAASCHHY